MAEPVNPLCMSERPTPLAPQPSDAERAADDGFPHLPLLEEWLPERATPTDPERSVEEPLHEEREDEQVSGHNR